MARHFTVFCRLGCVDDGCGPADKNGGQQKTDFMGETYGDEDELSRQQGRPRQGLVTYSADAHLPLLSPAVRSGEVWHLCPEDGKSFRKAILYLHANGLAVKPMEDQPLELSIAWSPFSLVQACRLHSVQADKDQHWMRLFKVSIFHHGLTHYFATQGGEADTERARWVADVSRALRTLTQSLFPSFRLRVEPLDGMDWTATRILAGYLLLYDELGVSLVYAELHCECDTSALFAAYEDEHCDVQVLNLALEMSTVVSERVGVDCSCFSIGDHHFAARTCAEKNLWLRAISNVKVKLRHKTSNPTATDLRNYRAAVFEHIRQLPRIPEDEIAERGPLLPRRTRLPAAPAMHSPTSCGADRPFAVSNAAVVRKPRPAAMQAELIPPLDKDQPEPAPEDVSRRVNI
mmetsp:Transcript_96607/g.288424  ORF Transcript_96607/g.288424 Transcript_96607/m.288424 type:complete len:404 (+) Transcript_96607:177-1388(+)